MPRQLKVSAPGKVILFGEHAVVLNKTAIATSLSLRTYITFTASDGNGDAKLSLDLPNMEVPFKREWLISDVLAMFKDVKLDPHTPTACSPELFELIQRFTHEDKGVSAFLYLFGAIAGQTCGHKGGFDVVIHSDLPMGAGLGSSAAFCVCIAAGMLFNYGVFACGEKGCPQCADAAASTATGNDSGLPCYKQCELINAWSLQGEKIMHGNPSGVDNAVATFGKALTFSKLTGFKHLERVPSVRILITNTKVARQTKKLVDGVLKRHKLFPTVIDPILDMIDKLTHECTQTFDWYYQQTSTETDVTPREASDYLTAKLELLIDVNHSLLTGGLGVGHPALDNICRITSSFGLHSKLTGAGGGGCAITLIPKDVVESTVGEVKAELVEAGYECWEASIGGAGVFVHVEEKGKL